MSVPARQLRQHRHLSDWRLLSSSDTIRHSYELNDCCEQQVDEAAYRLAEDSMPGTAASLRVHQVARARHELEYSQQQFRKQLLPVGVRRTTMLLCVPTEQNTEQRT